MASKSADVRQKLQWHVLSAKSATTSHARTAVTIQIA